MTNRIRPGETLVVKNRKDCNYDESPNFTHEMDVKWAGKVVHAYKVSGGLLYIKEDGQKYSWREEWFERQHLSDELFDI